MSAMRLLRAGWRQPASGAGELLLELEAVVDGGRRRGRGAAFCAPDAREDLAIHLATLAERATSALSPAHLALALEEALPHAPVRAAAEGALVDLHLDGSGADPRPVVLRRLLEEEPPSHPRPRPPWLWLRPLVDPADMQALEALIDAWMPRWFAVPLAPDADAAAFDDLAARLDRRVEPYHVVLMGTEEARPEALASIWQEFAGRRRLARFAASLAFGEDLARNAQDHPLPEAVRALRPLAANAGAPPAALAERGFAGLVLDAATGPLSALRLRRTVDAYNRQAGRTVLQLALSGVPPLAIPALLQILRTARLAGLDHVGLAGADLVPARIGEARALAAAFTGLFRAVQAGLSADVAFGRVDVGALFRRLADLPWPEDVESIVEV